MATSKKDGSSVDGMSKLTIDSAKASKPTKTRKNAVADSWEDEDVSSEDEALGGSKTPALSAPEGTTAPPPTPISPNYNNTPLHYSPLGEPLPTSPNATPGSADGPRARPRTTDAVARRMIAASLGVKAPKPTEEQKAYDRSVREQERKRLNEQRAKDAHKAEEAERAKKAIWED